MSLTQKLNDDLKEAMKSREELKLSVLRMLVSSIRNRQTEKRTKLSKDGVAESELEEKSQLNDDEAMEVIRSEAKKRKDAIDGFEKGGRVEMAEKERHELAVIQGYLPAELNDDELQVLVAEAVTKTGAASAKDFGKVMGYVMARAKNQVSGDRVSAAVKSALANG